MPEKTILRTKDWVDNQVAESVAMLYEAFNDDNLFLDYLLKLGKAKMTPEQHQLAKDFKTNLNQQLMVKNHMKLSLRELTKDADKNIYINHAERHAKKLTKETIEHFQQKELALKHKYQELLTKETQLNQLIDMYGAVNIKKKYFQSTWYNIYYVN